MSKSKSRYSEWFYLSPIEISFFSGVVGVGVVDRIVVMISECFTGFEELREAILKLMSIGTNTAFRTTVVIET